MPRTLSKTEKARNSLSDWIFCTMKRLNITCDEMGDALNMTRQTFARRVKEGTLTYNDLVKVFQRLGADDTNNYFIF